MSEEINLTALVAQEIAKTSVEKAFSLVDKLLGKPCEEFGELLADKIRAKRQQNQINTLIKTQEIIDKNKISIREIPFKFLTQFMEKVSLENDSYMREKWAHLLANSADNKNKILPQYGFIHILDQLAPIEVNLLDRLYDELTKNDFDENYHIQKNRILEVMQVNDEQYYIMIGNLRRLNLLRAPMSGKGTGLGNKDKTILPFTLTSDDYSFMTTFGINFVKSCR